MLFVVDTNDIEGDNLMRWSVWPFFCAKKTKSASIFNMKPEKRRRRENERKGLKTKAKGII